MLEISRPSSFVNSRPTGVSMACSTTIKKEQNILDYSKAFPPVSDGRINVVKFLEASTDLVAVVERLGTVFGPVKKDMQGNIDKIKKNFKYDDNSCLLELMLEEASTGKTIVTEGILWLNRALLFFELAFVEILKHLKANNIDVNMNRIITIAYEGSVKKYHSWITQQLFTFICSMAPSLPQALSSLGVAKDFKGFEVNLENYNVTLNLVRCKIDNFFKDHNLL